MMIFSGCSNDSDAISSQTRVNPKQDQSVFSRKPLPVNPFGEVHWTVTANIVDNSSNPPGCFTIAITVLMHDQYGTAWQVGYGTAQVGDGCNRPSPRTSCEGQYLDNYILSDSYLYEYCLKDLWSTYPASYNAYLSARRAAVGF